MKKKLIGLGIAAALIFGGVAIPASPAFAEEAAEAKTIKPVAHYEFNDEKKPGLDSSENGFDLTKKTTGGTMEVLQDTDGENYLSLKRKDESASGGGAFLYASELGSTGRDFSDFIEESYTVSLTFRRDNSAWNGSHYVLSVGRYNDAFTITPYGGNIEIQYNAHHTAPGVSDEEKGEWLGAHKYRIPCDTNEWTTVTVCAEATTNMVSFYLNGEIVGAEQCNDVSLTWRDSQYTFTLGAQCMVTGNSSQQCATVAIKDCRVYDCALSEDNVRNLCEGKDAVVDADMVYITEVAAIDTSELNLLVTDQNPVEEIMYGQLPTQVMTTLSNGMKMPARVSWYPHAKENKIIGRLQSLYANVDQLTAEVEYNYTVNFDYDESLVRIGALKLDGNAYELGTPIDGKLHTVTFTVTPVNEYVQISGVIFKEMEQTPMEGTYYIYVMGGANVYIEADVQSGKVTYYDGEEKLGTSKYTYGGDEPLKAYDKEGYTFVGWYTDAELTQAYGGLDYNNPVDITLYAKYVFGTEIPNPDTGKEDETDKKGGCGSVIGVSVAALTALAAGFVVFNKRK